MAIEKRSIGDRLLDPSYKPQQADNDQFSPIRDWRKTTKVPIKFTEDILEYAESKDFLGLDLFPKQRQFLGEFFATDAMNYPKYDTGVLIAGMRSGKSMQIGTYIFMYDGTLKKVEDLVVGDLLMGPDSKSRKVVATSLGESEMFEIQQSCADTYVVNDVHILSLKKAQSAKLENRYTEETETVNIPIKEYLNKSSKWKYFFRGYKAGCFNFPEQPVPIDPYFLSIWLGDGTATKMQITTMDQEVVDYLYTFANNQNLDISIYTEKRTKAIRVNLIRRQGDISNSLLDKFRELNLIQNKHIPQCYISNSKEIRLQLLAGLLDSDGHYRKHGYEITLANKTLAYDVKRLADSLGYRTHMQEKKTTCKNKETGYNFEGVAWRLSIYGDVWEIPMRVEHKKYVHNGKSTNKEEGLSSLKVRSIGWGKYAGIAVDGDHLFCLADGTVTHNSVTAGISSTFQAQRLLAFEDPARELRQMPGDRITIQVLASSEEQAKESIWAKICAIIDTNKYWQTYIEYLRKREETEGRGRLFEQKQLSIDFHEKNIALMSLHSNSAALAGKTSAFAAFDELARMDSIEGAVQARTQKRTADAVYYTVARSTKSLKGFAKTLVITSPLYESELSMRLLYMTGKLDVGSQAPIINALRTKYTERDPRAYGMHCTTLEFNPTLTEDDFISERTTNPEAYRRDYLAIPPAALSPFFEYPERVEKCVKEIEDPIMLFEDIILEDGVNTDEGFVSRMYIGKKIYPTRVDPFNKYYICCDQGEKKDSFVLAMGHLEEENITLKNNNGTEIPKTIYKVIIDTIEDWKPDRENRITVSFSNVEETIVKIAENFNVVKVTYDQWNSVESIQRLFSQGLYTEQLGINLDMYEEFKRLVYQGQVVLPRNDDLLTEIRQLNKIKGKFVDHPAGGSKDRSDAVCRVVYSIYMDYIKNAIDGGHMLGQNMELPTIRSLDQALGTVNESVFQSADPIWGAVGGGFNFEDTNVFGKGMVIQSNIVANIKHKR